MSVIEIIALLNTPILLGAFGWIIKVEKRLMKIETVCRLRCNSE